MATASGQNGCCTHPPALVGFDVGGTSPSPLARGERPSGLPFMPHTESNLGLQGAKARAGDLGRPQEIFRAGGWDQPRSIWKIMDNSRQHSPSGVRPSDLVNCSQALSGVEGSEASRENSFHCMINVDIGTRPSEDGPTAVR